MKTEEFTMKIKDLETAMDDQWKEIEELIERLDIDYKGEHYLLFNLKKYNKEEYSKFHEWHEAFKLQLLVKAYFEDILIVDILIDDIGESIILLDDSISMGKDITIKGLTKEESKEIGELTYYSNKWDMKNAKKILKALQKIRDKRHMIKEKGIETFADIHKRLLNKRYKDASKGTNRYINHKDSMENYFNDIDKELLLSKFNNGCALTGGKENIEFDHVIPISWRIFGTTTNNMIPLSKSLNASKGNKNIFRWYEANKDKFNIDESKFKDTINYIAKLNNMTYKEYETFVYECERKVIEKVKQLEQKMIELEIEKAKIDNQIFELKSEMTYLKDYDDIEYE